MDKIVYENPTGAESIRNENDTFFTVGRITYDGGIKQWLNGASFPSRGYCSPEAMFAACQVKRLIVVSTKVIIIGKPSKLLDVFVDWSWKIMSPHIIKYEYLTPVAQELNDITYNFLIQMGFNEIVALRFAKIFSHLIELDNAYRLRVEDMFDLVYKYELAKRPIRTIRYMIRKLSERDSPDVAIKFKRISWLITLALLIPKVRRSFRFAIEDSNFEKLQVDDTEFYWMCMREDYKFGGFSNKQRKNILKSRGWSMPISKKFNNVV